MNSREIQQKMAEYAILLEKIEHEEKQKKFEQEQKKREERNKIIKNESAAIGELNKKWMLACKTQSLDDINKLLQEFHVIPYTQLTSYDLDDQNHDGKGKERKNFYYIGITEAISHGNLELLQRLWNDYIEHIPKLYDKPFSPNNLFDAPYTDKNALIFAILQNQERCASWLLSQGFDPNSLYCEKNCDRYENFNQLQGTALTLAISHNMTGLAKELIQKGAWTGNHYTNKLQEWQQAGKTTSTYHMTTYHYDRHHFHYDFDALHQPLFFAAQYNNKDLVQCLLETNENNYYVNPVLRKNSQRKTPIDLTTDREIRQLLLAKLTLVERVNRLGIDEQLPKNLTCSITGKIVRLPVIDHEKNIICLEALYDRPHSDYKGPNNKMLTKYELLDLFRLPIDTTLQSAAVNFVLEKEAAEFELVSNCTQSKRL